MRSRRRRPSHSGELPVAWLPWSLLQETIGCLLSKAVERKCKVVEVIEVVEGVDGEVIEVDVTSITSTTSTTSVVKHLQLCRDLVRRVAHVGVEPGVGELEVRVVAGDV